VDPLGTELGVGGLTAELELPLLAVLSTLGTLEDSASRQGQQDGTDRLEANS
jgi:hypothetical protein